MSTSSCSGIRESEGSCDDGKESCDEDKYVAPDDGVSDAAKNMGVLGGGFLVQRTVLQKHSACCHRDRTRGGRKPTHARLGNRAAVMWRGVKGGKGDHRWVGLRPANSNVSLIESGSADR